MRGEGSSALLYFLLNRDISAFDPTIRPTSASLRQATLEQKLYALPPVARFWLHQLRLGTLVVPGLSTHSIASPWPDSAPVATLYEAYLGYCESTGLRHPVGLEIFCKHMKKLCPGLEKTRPTEAGQRVWKYKLPPLKAARQEFEQHLKETIDWDTDA